MKLFGIILKNGQSAFVPAEGAVAAAKYWDEWAGQFENRKFAEVSMIREIATKVPAGAIYLGPEPVSQQFPQGVQPQVQVPTADGDNGPIVKD